MVISTRCRTQYPKISQARVELSVQSWTLPLSATRDRDMDGYDFFLGAAKVDWILNPITTKHRIVSIIGHMPPDLGMSGRA